MKQVGFTLPTYRWIGFRSVEKKITCRRMEVYFVQNYIHGAMRLS